MAVPPPPSIDRATLRGVLKARRQSFAGDAGAIAELLAPLLAESGPIAGYAAHRGEPDILPFLTRASDLGCTVALPCMDEGAIVFRRWQPGMTLEPDALGIMQPPSDSETVEPAIVLAPLVGFDRAGHRLGQGGGHYDRWFARHPHAGRIGIAWSVQEVAALAHEPWDAPLHAIVTEQEWIDA